MRRVIGYVAALYFVLWGLLIVSERQILVWETVIGEATILFAMYLLQWRQDNSEVISRLLYGDLSTAAPRNP